MTAKAGTRLKILTPEPCLGMSIKARKGLWESRHGERWKILQDCKHARNMIARSFGTVSKTFLAMSRAKVAKATEF